MLSKSKDFTPAAARTSAGTPPLGGNNFYIQTFGCQMNVYDGQRISAMLVGRGWTETDKIEHADIVILNTCSVREKATNKVFSALGRIRDKKKPGALFGIVGCVARESGGDAFRRIPELNFVLGPQSYHKLPEIIDNPDTKLLNIDLSGLEKFDALTSSIIHHPSSMAYIPIQEGCDHCCTYCIVPFTRGRELSRPYSDVMRDVNAAAENGAIEICFLGQNVNGYRAPMAHDKRGVMSDECGVDDKKNKSTLNTQHSTLTDLIRATAKIKTVRRIRFTSSYPTEMTDDLIDLFRTEPKLLPFLNMPIQSGSENILKKMNRPYSLESYMDIIDKLRAARPDIQISSDFIVGFPGESDADFAATMDVARRIRYINSYTFKYSPRPHTAAALMPDQVPENIKRERLKTLDNLLMDIQREFNESCIGKTFECLCEGLDKTGRNLVFRTPYMQQVIIEGAGKSVESLDFRVESLDNNQNLESLNSKISTLKSIKITAANKSSLRGEIVSESNS